MPVSAVRVNVGTSPTSLAKPGGAQKATSTLSHQGPLSVFLGGADVTVAQGFELPPNVPVSFELDTDDEVFGIVASGTVAVSTLRVQ